MGCEGIEVEADEEEGCETEPVEEEMIVSEEEDQAMITIYAQSYPQTCLQPQLAKTFKFKGYMGNIPVCNLVDSGSIHSFVNPELTNTLQITTTQTKPMMVTIANGTQMNCTHLCKKLKFSIQNQEFDMDLRVMKVSGYDVILGIDWLTTTGVMTVDWGKGIMQFNYKGSLVKLQIREEKAKVRFCELKLNIEKEKKKGSQVLIAQLFCASGKEGRGTGRALPIKNKRNFEGI